MTSTPLREHMDPNTFPTIVFGTMSPYLEHRKTDDSEHTVQENKKKNTHIPTKAPAPEACFVMLSLHVINVIFTPLEIVTVTLDYFTTSKSKSHI